MGKGTTGTQFKALWKRYGFAVLEQSLATPDQWRPFPTVDDRAQWEAVRPERRDVVLAAAQRWRGHTWPVLPASLYADYTRTGVRIRYERAYNERRAALTCLTLAEALTGTHQNIDLITDLVWMMCEQTSWCFPATSHPPRLENGPAWDGTLPDHRFPVVDLFASDTASLLAWVHYLLRPVLHPAVLTRITDEVRRRILEPYRLVDEWRWLREGADGRPPSNWNPWIHSNLLAATLALEDDPYTRTALVARIVRGLDAFLDGCGDDGGCEEGISYFWQAGARLFEALDLLSAATGIDAFDLEKVHQIGRFPMRMHVGGDWYVNVGDASARQVGGGELLYRFGKRLGDKEICTQARSMRTPAFSAATVDGRSPMHRVLAALLDTEYADAGPADAPLPRDCWLPDVQVLTCREREASTDGLFLAVIGGHNGVGHNHNDVGSFQVALDGEPVLIDVGVGVYTRQTFDAQRYGLWTMRSAFHNVPLIDGREQLPGREYQAHNVSCEITAGQTGLCLDLAGTYPQDSGLRSWVRTARLHRNPGRIVIADEYEFIRQPETLALHLMSRFEPQFSPGRIALRSLIIEHDPSLHARSERIDIDDSRLAEAWPDALYRIVLEIAHPAQSGTLQLNMSAHPHSPN